MTTHKDLIVWQESVRLITDIYHTTRNFPKEEMYGLTQQIRRATVSIGSNISEGAARNSTQQFIHFLSISLGSQAELELQLLVAKNLSFIDEDEYKTLNERNNSIGKMLIALIRSLERRSK